MQMIRQVAETRQDAPGQSVTGSAPRVPSPSRKPRRASNLAPAILLFLSLVAGPPRPACGADLIAADWGVRPGLYEIDRVTGATRLRVPVTGMPGDLLFGIAWDAATGQLYATGSEILGPDSLLEIDPDSGATLAADLSVFLPFGSLDIAEGDVAVEPSNGLVYCLSSGGSIHIWDPYSRQKSYWYSLPATNDYSGLAFNAAGELFVLNPNSRSEQPATLQKLNPANGAILQTTPLNARLGVVLGLAFDPDTDEAWVADGCLEGDACTGSRLFRLDPAAGALTFVAEMAAPMSGLTFRTTRDVSGEVAVFDGPTDGAAELVDGQSDPISFGTVVRNSRFVRPITVKNHGPEPLTILRLGAGPVYSVTNHPPLPLVLGAGTSFTFDLVLDTAGGGPYPGTLTVVSSDADENRFVVPLSAHVPVESAIRVVGPSGPLASGQSTAVVFQPNPFGGGSATSYQVSTDGPDPLVLSGVIVPQGFSFTVNAAGGPVIMPLTIPVGGSGSVVVSSVGPVPGAYSGAVHLLVEDAARTDFVFPIFALHDLPEIDVSVVGTGQISSGATIDFGATPFGTPVARRFAIKNLHQSSLTVTGISMPPGYGFTLPAPSFPLTLSRNQTLNVTVLLAATTSGVFSGPLVIHNSDYDEGAFEVQLDGRVREDSITFHGFSSHILEGPSASVSAFAVGLNFGAVTYAWDLDGDGAYDDFIGATVPLTDSDGPGEFLARVKVSDTRSSGVFAGTVPVLNAAPLLAGSLPESVAAGSEVVLEVTASDAAADAAAGLAWELDWGDGTTASRGPGSPSPQTFRHTYTQPGVARSIELRATDKDGGAGLWSAQAWVHSGVFGFFEGDSPTGGELRDEESRLQFSAPVGQAADRQLTVINRSSAPATLGPATLPVGFSIAAPPDLPVVVPPGGVLTLALRFNPKVFGGFGGVVTIQTSDPLMPEFDLALEATVEAPDLVVNQFGQEKYDLANGIGIFSIPPGSGPFDGLEFNLVNANGSRPLIVAAVELPPGFSLHGPPAFPIVIDDNSGPVDIRLQATNTAARFAKGRVKIQSNDPDESPFEFYVTARIGNVSDLLVITAEGFPEFDTAGSALGVLLHDQDEPLVFPGPKPSERGLVLLNQGNIDLTVSAITLPTDFVFVSPPALPVTLGFYQSHTLPPIRLSTDAPGLYTGHLVIASTDPDESLYRVPLRAEVAGPPASAPRLSIRALTPAGPHGPATLSGTVDGGTPNGSVLLEASTDFGLSHPWTAIATVPLDANGAATFGPVSDPASLGATSGFFRLRVP